MFADSLPGTPIRQAPEAVANKAIKAAAAKLEHDEMAASPAHTMRKRDEGGLASAVQVRVRPSMRRFPVRRNLGFFKHVGWLASTARSAHSVCRQHAATSTSMRQWTGALGALPALPCTWQAAIWHAHRRAQHGPLQEAAQSTARPDLNPVVAAVHERVRAMQADGSAR